MVSEILLYVSVILYGIASAILTTRVIKLERDYDYFKEKSDAKLDYANDKITDVMYEVRALKEYIGVETERTESRFKVIKKK